jgi:SNF2 family DNA or RNA helicase
MDLSDTRFPGFLSLISPFILRRAKRARRKGVDKELMKKYWGEEV